MAFCPNCGNLLNEGDQFCSKCGKSTNNNISSEFQINITREKGFVASLTSYKVCFNGLEVGSLSNGETKEFKAFDRQKFLLKVYPWGDSVSIHKMACEVEIDPSQCRTNIINCRVVTEVKTAGILMPLFSAPGKITIYVDYQ